MPSQQIESRRKVRWSVYIWLVMASGFGTLTVATYGTKWLSVCFAIATAFCFGWFLVRFFGWYWHLLLGWLWRRAVRTDKSS
jgi:hypothetical protein